ncbi:baseplate wedge subunit [Edwardsiella phage PEi20]|uniref:Baseplate wedge subunit and tail pin n=2 Tax=Kanagawavirus pei20 TaxID=2844109 RepID=A0A0B6VTW1_9CAUD|nr:baseplate wedge subunit [Edwardsiella phage PEi20]BAQ22828.1 baseplate wedge subunit and tail pin [Edwardsiella phage PEi20]BAQ23131.1 baseplate wedge subunit and tail pin [Edwardsiella phage PEi26]
MFSLTRSKAGLVSRLADYLQFRTNPKKPAFVAGQRPLGAANVSATSKGIFYPTVQGAIDDLAGRCELPIDSVIMNVSGTAPRVINQSDQLAFTGDVIGEVGTQIMIYVFGFPVIVEGGDSSIAVASKVQAVLAEAVISGTAIASVEVDATDASILNITYNDYQDHVFEPESQYGVTMTQTTVVEPQPGYGDWEWLGSAAQTLAGGSVDGTITFHYFKRTA